MIHEDARMLMEFSVGKDDWDEMPMLFVQHEKAQGAPGLTIIGLASTDGSSLTDILTDLNQKLMQGGEGPEPAPLLGVALLFEGWTREPQRTEIKNMISYDGETMRSLVYRRDDDAGIIAVESTGGTVDALKDTYAILKVAMTP